MDFSALNWIDYLFLAILLCGAVFGCLRGLAHELAVLIRMSIALLVTRFAYEPIGADIAAAWNWNPAVSRFVAVIAVFVLSLVILWLFFKTLGILMEFRFRGIPERIGGLFVGAIRYGVVFLLVLLALYFSPAAGIQRAIAFDSKVGSFCIPHLVDGYNAVAQKAAIIQAEIPVGVRVPDAIMPPNPGEP